MLNFNNSILLSVIIPAFNEEDRISDTIVELNAYFMKQKYNTEIIIVDDGSNDRTASLVKNMRIEIPNAHLIKNGKNRGKGFSIKNGFLNSKGKLLLFSDADLSTPIGEVEKMMNLLGSCYDICIGSRGLRKSEIRIHQPRYREFMGRIFNSIVKILAVKDIKDTQCGFKLFKRECGLKIFKLQRIERFSFDVEALYLARKFDYKIREVPVVWFNDPISKVNAIKDSYQMFLDLIRIRINDLRGLYG